MKLIWENTGVKEFILALGCFGSRRRRVSDLSAWQSYMTIICYLQTTSRVAQPNNQAHFCSYWYVSSLGFCAANVKIQCVKISVKVGAKGLWIDKVMCIIDFSTSCYEGPIL